MGLRYRQSGSDRLEKQPTDLAAARQSTSYFGDRTLVCQNGLLMNWETHRTVDRVVATAILFSGCSSSDPSNPNSAQPPSAGESTVEFEPPLKGETTDQVPVTQ